MIIVGCYKTNGGYIPLHLDNDDHITSLLSLGGGVDKSEGCTFYVQNKATDDTSKSGSPLVQIKKRVMYEHGNLQIGCYDNVLHGTNRWLRGNRGVINFSMQKKIIEHFLKHGCRFFQQYVDAGFPSGDFIAEA